MVAKDEKELTDLLTKLYTLQEDVGAKPKTSTEEKQNKANASMIGRGRAAKKTGSRFMELKASVVARLKKIHGLLDEEIKRAQGLVSVASGNNPKEVIARQAELREEIRQSEDEWKEMQGLYKGEARKKRSKFTKEQLDVQQTLVQRLQAEIQKVKDAQTQGYIRREKTDDAVKYNVSALSSFNGGASDATNGNPFSAGEESGGVELTATQSQQLQLIDERDKEFDKTLDEIGEGIQDLNEIAQLQSEEVQRQNIMLTNVEGKIESTKEHILSVNEKMKETLNEVRSSDKICVDIMCIVVMVGLGAVIYHIAKRST